MKRILLGFLIVLAVGASSFTVRAGGWHGCGGGGWHGGHGCYGYYGGHGCYGGYYGGHGCYGWGWWPSFSFGIGFGGYYPGYASYGYPYAPVAYAAPSYVYYAAQPYSPTVSVAVAATPTVRAVATVPVYVHSRPAPAPAVQKPYSPPPPKPAVAPAGSAPLVASSRPASGTWVLDPNPYRYTPAVTAPSGGTASYVAAR